MMEVEPGHNPNAGPVALKDLQYNINTPEWETPTESPTVKKWELSEEGARLLRAAGQDAIWLSGGTDQWFRGSAAPRHDV
jgi:hypothetical protein